MSENEVKKHKRTWIISGSFMLLMFIILISVDGISSVSLMLLLGPSYALYQVTRSKESLDKMKSKEDAERAKARKEMHYYASGDAKKIIKCPKCHSRDAQFMQNNKKGFSVGKAVGGAALTGGIGTLAGFAGKKGKNEWLCTNCNTTFETK
ncbi:hypothetical protein [Enterococcus spodopteracolus]|uniref:hypothetical protein n=1 Tax=Enterococcus spodopteracolus TaxID=3034501 RepID=UPI002648E948|nr:hypothetical protein [Enterococcus spodopteracolus]MDO7880389.1 hypothetical protein [Enterococcus mundtii]